MGKNSDSGRQSGGNQYNNRGNRDRGGNQYKNRNYYGNNGTKNQQQQDSINMIIDSALKTARENVTDTAQSDMGNMSMSINTFSIADFVEDYNGDYNKKGSLEHQDLHKQPDGSQPFDNQILGSQPLDNRPLRSQPIDEELPRGGQPVDFQGLDQPWTQEQLLVE